MLLEPIQRSKLDESDDELFYDLPRLVLHIDEAFVEQIGNLYRERLKPNTRILDMMSSWVSHLPEEMEFAHVEGHGMNEEELAKNPRLNNYFVQDLNKNPQLPLSDLSFDAVLNAVSVQYLQNPEAVFAEIHRILKPGGIAIISFSNRMFYQKAIQAWRDGTDASRLELVKSYFNSVPGFKGFSVPEVIARRGSTPGLLQFLGVGVSDPFYAVIAYNNS